MALMTSGIVITAAVGRDRAHANLEYAKRCAGTIVTFVIQNRYNTYDYGGAKYVVISKCHQH